jgi:hypothetical protein
MAEATASSRTPMYINLSKKPRKTNRTKTARYRAKLKRKQIKRLKRMIT